MGTLTIQENNVELFVMPNMSEADARILAAQLVDSAKFNCEATFFVDGFWNWVLTKEKEVIRRKVTQTT